MTTVRDLVRLYETRNDDSDLNFINAVENYDPAIWDRDVAIMNLPIDALVFAEHQTPWTSFDQYCKDRCKHDQETNDWLVNYVWQMAHDSYKLPPVLVHLTDTGLALVDGCHRTSALLMFGLHFRIEAWVVQ